jgi:iron complex outermembrane receptor protein
VSDKDSLAWRAALDWLASDAVTVQLSVDGSRDEAEPKGYQRLQANPLCPIFLGGATCPPLDDRYDTQSGLAPKNGTDSEGYALTVSWDVAPAWEVKSITAYRETDSENNIDFDTTPAPIVDVIATYSDEQFSQELQLVYAGEGRLDGVVGVYYFDGEAGGLVLNNFINTLFGSTAGTTYTEAYALFGDGSYRLGDRTTLNFGLRVTEEEKRGVALNQGFTDGTFTTVNAVVADYDKSETFTSVAPRIGLDYRINDDVMTYVTASRGFKSGWRWRCEPGRA